MIPKWLWEYAAGVYGCLGVVGLSGDTRPDTHTVSSCNLNGDNYDLT